MDIKTLLTHYTTGICGKPLSVLSTQPTNENTLESSDGYILQDSNGLYLIAKENE